MNSPRLVRFLKNIWKQSETLRQNAIFFFIVGVITVAVYGSGYFVNYILGVFDSIQYIKPTESGIHIAITFWGMLALSCVFCFMMVGRVASECSNLENTINSILLSLTH